MNLIQFDFLIYNFQVLQDGNTLDNELEVVEGMKLARGYISPYFVTDQKTQKCVSSDLYCFRCICTLNRGLLVAFVLELGCQYRACAALVYSFLYVFFSFS